MTSRPLLTGDLTDQVRSFVEDHFGTGAEVWAGPSAGHSGQTLQLVVTRQRHRVAHLALRLGPAGVPQRGTADLARQARLMSVAGAHGVPVPTVLASGPGPPWFDVGFHATEWVAGEIVNDWDRDTSGPPEAVRSARLGHSVEVLARLHAIPVPATGLDPSEARGPEQEVSHWLSLARRLPEGPGMDGVADCAAALLASVPRSAGLGLLHGDYRAGNLIYAGSRVRAVLDWEVAGISPVLLDLAWLLFFRQAASWYGQGAALDDGHRAGLIERYSRCTGTDLGDMAWYEGLARFRYAVIILFNHHLHTTGRRLDVLWDRMAECVPAVLAGCRRAIGLPARGGVP